MRVLISLAVTVAFSGALGSEPTLKELWQPKALSEEEQAKVDAAPLGSPENPIRCVMVAGERAYFNRLRCPSGRAGKYKRVGSVGEGPYDMIMDLYQVRCEEWDTPAEVFIDMYHKGYVENRAVPRFSIAPAE